VNTAPHGGVTAWAVRSVKPCFLKEKLVLKRESETRIFAGFFNRLGPVKKLFDDEIFVFQENFLYSSFRLSRMAVTYTPNRPNY